MRRWMVWRVRALAAAARRAGRRRRLAELRRRRRRHALFARGRRSRRDNVARLPQGVGIPDRRRIRRQGRDQRDVVPGDAHPVRRHAVPVLAVQSRDRARSAHRPRRWTFDPKVEIRKDNQTRKTDGARAALPRRRGVGRRARRRRGVVRAAHLRRRDRRPPDRARRADRRALRGLRQGRHRSTSTRCRTSAWGRSA